MSQLTGEIRDWMYTLGRLFRVRSDPVAEFVYEGGDSIPEEFLRQIIGEFEGQVRIDGWRNSADFPSLVSHYPYHSTSGFFHPVAKSGEDALDTLDGFLNRSRSSTKWYERTNVVVYAASLKNGKTSVAVELGREYWNPNDECGPRDVVGTDKFPFGFDVEIRGKLPAGKRLPQLSSVSETLYSPQQVVHHGF